jgi:hypothetical protein
MSRTQIRIFFSLLVSPLFITPDALALSLPSIMNLSSRPFLTRRQNGNSDAAGDLYGIGIRTGAYLQIFGMLLACIRSPKRTRVGIKLLSSAICVALLSSLTVLIYRRNISPSEAWLVLSLTNAYATPKAAALNSSGLKSGGVAQLFCSISGIWQDILLIWFFTTVIKDLPLLGTANQVWIFAPVDLFGGFRIVMIIYSVLCCLWLPVEVVCCLYLTTERFKEWTEGQTGDVIEGQPSRTGPARHWPSKHWSTCMTRLADFLTHLNDNQFVQKFQDAIDAHSDKFLDVTIYNPKFKVFFPQFNPWDEKERAEYFEMMFRRTMCVWGLMILVLTIAGVEKIIQYNNLAPQNDLSRPGQTIPFVLGIITIIEGTASACIPEALKPRLKETRHEVDDSRRGSEATEMEGRMPGGDFEQGPLKPLREGNY